MIQFYTKVGNRALNHFDHPFFRFPGGELHMKHEPETYTGKEIAVIQDRVEVEDFLKLQMWAEVVRSQGGTASAIVPYLPAARADRGVPCSGKLYANLINNAGLDALIAFDPHSATAESFYKDSDIFYKDSDIQVAMPDIIADHFKDFNYDGIIAPDEGALDRATYVAKSLKVPLLSAGKERDFETGKLTGFTSPEYINNGGKYLLVDDICDGGGTFNGLFDQMKLDGFYGELDLYVSHGIFSRGDAQLASRFRNIFTTDTMTQPDRPSKSIQVIPVMHKLFERV